MQLIVYLVICVVLCAKANAAYLNCSLFNPKEIKLVSLDVFAATMDLPSSLEKNIAGILPSLSSNQVSSLANDWMNAYGSHAGEVFDETVTGTSPFQWMLNTSLTEILADMKLTVTQSEFDALIKCWGVLIPWPGTADVLSKVAAAGIFLAPLSNGDANTLTSAMSIFSPSAPMKYIFNSDFPVGSFKPDSRMYAQVLPIANLSPSQYLHIAGAPSDAQGARKYGYFAGLVYNNPIPGIYAPCFSLTNITDLLTILGLN